MVGIRGRKLGNYERIIMFLFSARNTGRLVMWIINLAPLLN